MPAGPVNQRAPVPLRRIPNSVPLRAMAVTIVEPSTPAAASAADLAAGIERFRKKWSLPAMKRAAAATSADGCSRSTQRREQGAQ